MVGIQWWDVKRSVGLQELALQLSRLGWKRLGRVGLVKITVMGGVAERRRIWKNKIWGKSENLERRSIWNWRKKKNVMNWK